MNRRDVLKALAFGGSSLPLLTQGHAAEFALKIAPLTDLKSEWDAVKFAFVDDAALLTRVPKPPTPDSTLLEANGVFLSAYLLTCTHEGCTLALPDSDHKLECPCHGSVFNAFDGSPHSGIAGSSLQRLRLELREGDVYAIGFLV